MEQVEILRRWCLITTFIDIICRSCSKCLRNTRLPATDSPASFILNKAGMYEHVKNCVWTLEKSHYVFLLQYIQANHERLTFFISVCLEMGIFCTYSTFLFRELPLHYYFVSGHILQPDAELPDEQQPDNEHRLGEPGIVQEVADEDQEGEVLGNVATRIVNFHRQLNIHKNRRNEHIRRFGGNNVFIALLAREYGPQMREIDMIALVDRAIPGGFNIGFSRFIDL